MADISYRPRYHFVGLPWQAFMCKDPCEPDENTARTLAGIIIKCHCQILMLDLMSIVVRTLASVSVSGLLLYRMIECYGILIWNLVILPGRRLEELRAEFNRAIKLVDEGSWSAVLTSSFSTIIPLVMSGSLS